MKASVLFGAGWEDDSLEVLWRDAGRVFCRLWRDDAVGQTHAFIPIDPRWTHALSVGIRHDRVGVIRIEQVKRGPFRLGIDVNVLPTSFRNVDASECHGATLLMPSPLAGLSPR
jgi:hypothetical protein